MAAIIVDSIQELNVLETNAPMGNLPFFEEVMTEIVTVRPTDRRIDRVIGKLHLRKMGKEI